MLSANGSHDSRAGLALVVPHNWPSDELLRGFEAAGLALWSWNVDDDRSTMDERGFALQGMPWNAHLTFEDLSEHIHPADRDRVRAAFTATRGVEGSYVTDFRVVLSSEVRWISSRGRGEDVGMHHRRIPASSST